MRLVREGKKEEEDKEAGEIAKLTLRQRIAKKFSCAGNHHAKKEEATSYEKEINAQLNKIETIVQQALSQIT